MAINAGFLFAMTLHVQGGLGYSALRAGLMFAPTAVVFGAVGLTWRRWSAGLQRGLVPGGFVLVAVASAGAGLVMRDGGDGGFMLYAALVVMGMGMSLAFSPLLTRALANVRPEDAADASGVLVTVTQLGQLIGVATFGTLYLNRLDTPGAHGFGHALWVCALALSAAAIVGVSVGLVGRRQRGDSQQG